MDRSSSPAISNVENAARYLCMSRHALDHRVSRCQIPFARQGRSLFFDRHALDRWMIKGVKYGFTEERWSLVLPENDQRPVVPRVDGVRRQESRRATGQRDRARHSRRRARVSEGYNSVSWSSHVLRSIRARWAVSPACAGSEFRSQQRRENALYFRSPINEAAHASQATTAETSTGGMPLVQTAQGRAAAKTASSQGPEGSTPTPASRLTHRTGLRRRLDRRERSCSECRGNPGSSEHRRDLDGLGGKPVYNSYLWTTLLECRAIALRHHPSRFRKVGEAFNGCDNPTDLRSA